MRLFRTRKVLWLAGAALVLALVVAAHAVWLRALGNLLVRSEAPAHAEAVVVLAGDDSGRRILKAAELVKQGYAPLVLVSGPRCCYGMQESDLAIPFAVRHGYPEAWFIPVTSDARATRDEADVLAGEMRRRNIRRFLLVTSNYHTARAARVYAALVPRDRFRAIAAPDRDFDPDNWWTTRDGQKQCVFEWMKTFAYWAGR